MNMNDADKTKGLYNKFTVTRTDGSSGPGGRHEGCQYFALDLEHDPHAPAALSAYADSCRADYPELAADLDRMAETTTTATSRCTKAQYPLIANWSVGLHCECPKCGEFVNLLDAPDFWHSHTLDIPEHGTENSNNLEVACPECGHEFHVCCEW